MGDVLDPFDVGDQGNAVPSRETLHSNFEIFPGRAGVESEIRAGFVVEPELVVRAQRVRNSRHQNCVIISFGHTALASERDDVAGKVRELLDHWRPPCCFRSALLLAPQPS